MNLNYFFLKTFLLISLASTSRLEAFQLFSGESGYPQVDPSALEFTYYISPTYFDLLGNTEKQISPLLVAITHDAMGRLEKETSDIGLKFVFGGFIDTDSLPDAFVGKHFSRRIYFDFSSRSWSFSTGAPAGNASQRQVSPESTYSAGGIVRINGKFLNLHHPDIELFSTLIHETLHVFGVGHSTTASAMMAYTEHWIPALSSDDKSALATNFRIASGAAPIVSAKLGGSPAGGVEIVWIDSKRGKTFTTITQSDGVAAIHGLPEGSYYMAARELTPTGPCFSNPAKGFLTSFYVDENSSTNSFSNAAELDLTPGGSPTYILNLTPGTKKFDCHYVYAATCSDPSKCFLSRMQPGVTSRVNILNDLVTTHHNTDTDVNSGYHAGITLRAIGSETPLTFGSASLGTGVANDDGFDRENYTVANLNISDSATSGVYGALCESGGETALISGLLEVQNSTVMTTNKTYMSEFSEYFTSETSPRNYLQLLESTPPKQPQKMLGLACGSIGGVTGGLVEKNPSLIIISLILPLFQSLFIRRKRK